MTRLTNTITFNNIHLLYIYYQTTVYYTDRLQSLPSPCPSRPASSVYGEYERMATFVALGTGQLWLTRLDRSST